MRVLPASSRWPRSTPGESDSRRLFGVRVSHSCLKECSLALAINSHLLSSHNLNMCCCVFFRLPSRFDALPCKTPSWRQTSPAASSWTSPIFKCAHETCHPSPSYLRRCFVVRAGVEKAVVFLCVFLNKRACTTACLRFLVRHQIEFSLACILQLAQLAKINSSTIVYIGHHLSSTFAPIESNNFMGCKQR